MCIILTNQNLFVLYHFSLPLGFFESFFENCNSPDIDYEIRGSTRIYLQVYFLNSSSHQDAVSP